MVGLLGASGCATMMPRTAAPIPVNASVIVEGYSSIRARADVVNNDVEQAVAQQYQQILTRHGKNSTQARSVDFLAISGGGADGAFAAGFLNGWSQSGTRPQFEVVTGVSTGALVAPFAFLGKDYDRQLKKIFTQLTDADVYVSKGVFGVIGESILDPAPLRNLIEGVLTDPFLDALAVEYGLGRLLLVQTVDVERQVPYIWNLTKIAATAKSDRRRLITDILLASSAIPGAFPPVRINVVVDGQQIEELHVDGGLAAQVFFAPAGLDLRQHETKHFGGPRKQRLYLIRNGKLTPETLPTQPKTLELAKRAISTLIKYQSIEDIYRIQNSFGRTGLECHVASIPPSFSAPLNSEFDQDYMRALYKTGYAVGLGSSRWATPH
jgi:predicted patatin/cPLA2 family phospholipase